MARILSLLTIPVLAYLFLSVWLSCRVQTELYKDSLIDIERVALQRRRSNHSSPTFLLPYDRSDSESAQLLDQFRHPRLFFPEASIENPVHVFHYRLFPSLISDDAAKHFVEDGIEKSPFLRSITQKEAMKINRLNNTSVDNNVVWLASTANIWNRPGAWCNRLGELIVESKRGRLNHNVTMTWPIHLLHWADTHEAFHCRLAFNKTPSSFYYHKRSIVWGRHWNETIKSIDAGYIHSYNDWTNFSAAPLHHINFCVRSDLVSALKTVTELEFNYSETNKPFAEWNIPGAWDRPTDAAHFWPARGNGVDRGEWPLSQLRDTVSMTLEDMAWQNSSLSIFAALAGKAQHKGRNGVHLDYTRQLLKSKIVVVAQKDEWEDHYRLMEGLASGALVLSDVMLSLPKNLQNGRSIVLYHNQTHLRTLVQHYLDRPRERIAIAREGRRIAMSTHRSWHRMEEVVFGRILSVDKVE